MSSPIGTSPSAPLDASAWAEPPDQIELSPERASHFAIPRREQDTAEDHAFLLKLCERYGVTPPQAGLSHFSHEFGPFRLKWERHTEFVTYTFFHRGAFGEPFAAPALAQVATDRLGQLPGQVLAAIHIAMLAPWRSPPSPEELARHFIGEPPSIP